MLDWTPYQDLYGNLLASGLATLASRVMAADRRRQSVTVGPSSRVARDLNKPLIRLANVPTLRGDIGGERLRAFLLSADAEKIVAGLGVASIVDSPLLVDALRERFVCTMSWYAGLPESAIRDDAERLFSSVEQSVRESLSGRLHDGDESAAAMSAEPMLQDVLTATGKIRELFTDARVPDFAETSRFVAKYRQALRVRHGRLEPPNFDGAGAIRLEDLYVVPDFEVGRLGDESSRPNLRRNDGYTDERPLLTADELRASLHRTVVLGKPGAGKSSFARALCFWLADATPEAPDRGAVPLLVELRDYAVQQTVNGLGIVAYIEQMAKSTYQVAAPGNAIEYLLQSGRALLIFDGLDELLDLADRRKIRTDVETLAHLFPDASVVVTSRERGYREAPLDDRAFDVVRIRDFSPSQVEDYARKWFGLDRRLTRDEQDARIAAFLRESETVSDLRESPLLLALMCSLYRRLNYIPANRAAVYRECAEMLFDRWDRSRRIEVGRPIEAHLPQALQHIAQWIFGDQHLQAGVTHAQLVAHMEQYILHEVTDSRAEAHKAANDFVSFCHGRGWVLVPIGATESDEELYGFAHRTFLEYFTAAWHASSAADSDHLAQVVLPRVAQGEWEMVALLAFQLRRDALQPAGNELFAAILEHCEVADRRARAYLVAFGVRVFEFFVPNPDLVRAFTRTTLTHYLDDVGALWGARRMVSVDEYESLEFSLELLLRVRGESVSLVRTTMSDVLVAAVQGRDESRAVVAADFALVGRVPLPRQEPLVPESVVQPSIEGWIENDQRVGAWAQKWGLRSVTDVSRLAGVKWIFHEYQFPGSPASWSNGCAVLMLRAALSGISPLRHATDEPKSAAAFQRTMVELRDALVRWDLPWLTRGESEEVLRYEISLDRILDDQPGDRSPVPDRTWTSPVRLAFLLMLGTALELSDSTSRRRFSEAVAGSDDVPGRMAASLATFGIEDPEAFGLRDEDAAFFRSIQERRSRFVAP